MDQPIQTIQRVARASLLTAVGMGMLIALALSVGLIVVGDAFSVGVVRDLGIGLFVAVVVGFAAELYTRYSFKITLTGDIADVIFGHLLPPAIWDQVTTHILRADFTGTSFQIDIAIRSPHEAIAREFEARLGPGVHLMHYTVRWKVRNITAAARRFPWTSVIDVDLPFPEKGIPRISRVEVEGRNSANNIRLICVDPTAAQRAAASPTTEYVSPTTFAELLCATEETPPIDLKHVTLLHERNVELGFTLKLPRPIQPGETIDILYEAWRGIRSPGTFVYSLGMPADGITVHVSVPDGISYRVSAFHPDAGAMEETHDDEWTLDRGILPGQGVQVFFASNDGDGSTPGQAEGVAGPTATDPVSPAASAG